MGSYRRRTVAALREARRRREGAARPLRRRDSAVCAALLAEAVGERLTCVFVDHGMLRKGEGDAVEAGLCGRGMNCVRVNAQERFPPALAGVRRPEEKRKIIGAAFIRRLRGESRKLGAFDFLAQGTIYPDVIESAEAPPRSSRATTTSAACPQTCTSGRSWSRCGPSFKDEVRQPAGSSDCRRRWSAANPFPAGPGDPRPRARHAEKARRGPGGGRDLPGGAWPPPDSPARRISIRGADRPAQRRRHGRRAELRPRRGRSGPSPQRTSLTADRGAPAVRAAGDRLHAHRQRGAGVNRVLYDVTSKPPATMEYE